MGTFRHPVEIGDPTGTEFELVNPLVDTGAAYSFMPASLLERLGVETLREMIFITAGGGRIRRRIGQTWVRTRGREIVTIVVFGDDDSIPLLGAYALEGLGLAVDPVHERLVEMEEAYL